MSVLRKLVGQMAPAGALALLLQACDPRPSETLIGKWHNYDAVHKRGYWEFFTDGRCTHGSSESWGPPDTATYAIAGDSICFTMNQPIPPFCCRIVFENNDKFTLQPDIGLKPTWFVRVHE